MNKFILIAALLTFHGGTVQAESAIPGSAIPCPVAYFAGVEFFEQEQFEAASLAFQAALELAPEPTIVGEEYLPFIYLGAAQYELGRNRQARDALVQSQVFGVAPATDTGKKLIDRYAASIMSAPLDEASVEPAPLPDPFADQSHSLSQYEVDLIRAQVLKRCALSGKLDQNKLPWYFHYEFGLELMDAGDSRRALESFVLGANVRENPQRGKRMYGMWFIDYIPYYRIAFAHAKLGQWESARDALVTSRNFGEFSPTDPDYEKFSGLELIISKELASIDS